VRKLLILSVMATLVGVIPTAEAKPSVIVTTPKHPNFGAVQVGDTKNLTVTFINTTSSKVYISNFVLDSGVNFDAVDTSTCFTLPLSPEGYPVLLAGQSCNVELVFHPSVQGPIRGSLAVTYFFDASTDTPCPCPYTTVKLKGKGI
jgi:hypothetical protein